MVPSTPRHSSVTWSLKVVVSWKRETVAPLAWATVAVSTTPATPRIRGMHFFARAIEESVMATPFVWLRVVRASGPICAAPPGWSMAWPAHRAYVVVDGRPALFVVLLREASPSNVGHRWPGAQGEAGFLVTVVALPARGRPPQGGARRGGLGGGGG